MSLEEERTSISEIRKDYIADKWIVISAERAMRPDQWKDTYQREDSRQSCPFCPGNEKRTPPEVLAYGRGDGPPDSPGWDVRCIPNKFPVLRRDGSVDRKSVQIFNELSGYGAHEIVIETPHHDKNIAILPNSKVAKIIRAYHARYTELCKDHRIKYTLIFKNHGHEAGASIEHPHSQIIATPIIPKRIMEETKNARSHYEATGGNCIYDDIVNNELDQKERIIVADSDFLAICPFASSFPFEVWIIPRKHLPSFGDTTGRERRALAKVLKSVLERMYKILDDPPYNYIIHTAPCDGSDHRSYHWHVEIIPRLTRIAGFEWGTGFYVNPLPPEDAARFLRMEHVSGQE
ncbi:MAG: galactose-1-phosphate uridylyltransferase [Thermoplasmata archaeon]